MCLWCVYVKADPSDNTGSDEAATKSAHRVSALAQSPWGDQRIKFHLQGVATGTSPWHLGVWDEDCPAKPTCSSHLNVLRCS